MKEQDYVRDIAVMRSLMERSTKFLSLSGLAGVMAGVYALCGAFIAYKVFGFNPTQITGEANGSSGEMLRMIWLGLVILVLAIGTAIFLSYRNANKRREKFWNPTARLMLQHMMVPLIAGGLLMLILLEKGMIGFIAPFSLLFYGLALFNAGKFTYEEIKSLGIIQVVLGLISVYFVEYGLLCWALGFGVFHIIYGAYMHYRYER